MSNLMMRFTLMT